MGGHLLTSEKERTRKVIMEGVKEGRLSIRDASARLEISYRQGKRIYRRFRLVGDAGLLHRSRGRTSNRSKPPGLREQVIARYRERYEGFGPTLAAEKLSEEGLPVDHETLRRWLIGTGLWTNRAPKVRHRTYRERRKRFGELVQLDGSFHRWFGPDRPQTCLLNLVDDATGTTRSLMTEHEALEGAMRLLWRWIERYGVPAALYTDRHTIYHTDREPTLSEALAGEPPLTAFGRACRKLGIRIITAYSPQAKGRVERKHGVFQDRFHKELGLQEIRTIDGANALLEGCFVDDLNRRFAVPPMDPRDAHRPPLPTAQLARVFCREKERTVQNDFTVRHQGRCYQITKKNRFLPKPQGRVTILDLLDGTLECWFKNHRLHVDLLKTMPKKPPCPPKATAGKNLRPTPPVEDHPWRQPFKPEAIARLRQNTAATTGTFLTSPNRGHF
jgi:transposase